MQPPASLSDEARESFTYAAEAIERFGDRPEDYADSIERYSLAHATAGIVRAAWEAEGRPLVRAGTGAGPSRPHPLLVALRDCEAHAANLGDSLLLSPAARARAGRAGWKRGQARAEDRQPRRLRVAREAE